MKDWIVAMLNAIGSGVDGGTLDLLGNTPQAYSSTVYDFATKVNQVAVKPVAAVILSIMVAFQLARVSTRIDGDRPLGVKIIAATMFRIALLLIAAENAQLFLDAISEATGAIFSAMHDNATTIGDGVVATGLGDAVRNQFSDHDYMGMAGALIVLLIPFLAAKCSQLAVSAVVMLRFFELYLLTAFGSLPVAFLATDETKPMAVAYFRKYASTCVKSVTLYIGIWCYRALVSSGKMSIAGFSDGQHIWDWAIGNFVPLMMSSVVLLGAIGVANAVAKAIVGE